MESFVLNIYLYLTLPFLMCFIFKPTFGILCLIRLLSVSPTVLFWGESTGRTVKVFIKFLNENCIILSAVQIKPS